MPLRVNKGLIIFMALVLVFVVAGAVAYLLSGEKGIEERFSEALGLGGDEEEGGGGFFGFSVEGDVLLYALILGALIVGCLILLKIFKV